MFGTQTAMAATKNAQMLVIGMGSMLGYALTIFQVPHELGRLLDAFAPGKILFLLFVQISFYIIGTCMDTLPLC